MQTISEILQQFSGLIYTIVGALIAWGCTELSRHFANSYQKKQTLNSTLSLLLELYFQMKRISSISAQMQECLDWYVSFLSQNESTKEVKDEVAIQLKNLITPIISNLVSNELKTLSDDYENALKNLACYYPVAAYRLRGRADVKYILLDMDVYFKEIEEQLSMPISEYEKYFACLKSMPLSNMMAGGLNVLKDEISDLAKDINFCQRKEILQTLDDMNIPNETYKQHLESLKKQMEVVLDEILKNTQHLKLH